MKKVLMIACILVVIVLCYAVYQWTDYLFADYKLWPDGVVYYRFEGHGWEEDKKSFVRVCLNEWESGTCIKFIELEDVNKDDIYCRVLLGDSSKSKKGYRKNSYVQFSPFNRYGVLHEFGHVLGLTHEHQRPDRDKYIKMNWSNIKLLSQHNFWKIDNPYLDWDKHPYDYKSIMHYGCYSKAVRGTSFSPLSKDYICGRYLVDPKIVGGLKITELDYMKVNAMYKEEACK